MRRGSPEGLQEMVKPKTNRDKGGTWERVMPQWGAEKRGRKRRIRNGERKTVQKEPFFCEGNKRGRELSAAIDGRKEGRCCPMSNT